mmetsp:Transcript_2767/g.10661  ORF Transcript_2767/g.10661 Transcript_2767/m.10661 type:complete len:266 (-) Transcript_2767:848-1645(-)
MSQSAATAPLFTKTSQRSWDPGNESRSSTKIAGFSSLFSGMADGLTDTASHAARSIRVAPKRMDSSCSDSPLLAERSTSSESKYCTVFVKGHISFSSIETKARTVRTCCTNKYAIHESVLARRTLSLLTSISNTRLPTLLFSQFSVASYKMRLASSLMIASVLCDASTINLRSNLNCVTESTALSFRRRMASLSSSSSSSRSLASSPSTVLSSVFNTQRLNNITTMPTHPGPRTASVQSEPMKASTGSSAAKLASVAFDKRCAVA